MALNPGTWLAEYEVAALIGAGGMGDVYRALDTKLGREVALKVLPESFAGDEERLARFEREARILASLNHPNIAAIYGLEESEGVHFLAMELVEGETLAERLARGPISDAEALPIFEQIADALAAAHAKGIVHRDLKPSNIKITPEGIVKVLDFGLAKALRTETPAASVSSESPTLTREGTRTGVIMGTAAYMSPEQARGSDVNAQTDIWAFGCVLYEVLAGRKAFNGGTTSDILASILKDDPDWTAVPDDVPANVRMLLRRCLRKDSAGRFHDMADVRIEIEEARARAPAAEEAAIVERRGWRWGRALLLLLAGLISGGLASLSFLRPGPSTPRSPVRFSINLPSTHEWVPTYGSVALSADGTDLVYAARHEGREELYLRPLASLEARATRGGEGARAPFFSPDGKWVGFQAEGKLKKVSIDGGTPVTLCDYLVPRGASWGPDDVIYFVPSATSGIMRVGAAGGTPQPVTTLDSANGELGHLWPEILPSGTAVLFTLWRTAGTAVAVFSLATGEQRLLIEDGTYPRYAESGHIVFRREGSLLAAPFDLERLEVTGPPVPVVEEVLAGGNAAAFALSNEGSLVYVPGPRTPPLSSLLWVDRRGASRPITQEQRGYGQPRLSPDGGRIALHVLAVTTDVWVYELARGTSTRLTFEGSVNSRPIWSPDGKWLTFRSNRGGEANVFRKASDGSGPAERLTASENNQIPTSWSPDGSVLAYTENNPATGLDIWILPVEGGRKPQSFLQTSFDERHAVFSPDGRWIAYTSNESGRDEVYVQPYPGPGGKVQVSNQGGSQPMWARDGEELFYRNRSRFLVVSVTTEPAFSAGRPGLLFEEAFDEGRSAGLGMDWSANYDVTADGDGFVMIKTVGPQSTQMNVVLDWFGELERLVPAK